MLENRLDTIWSKATVLPTGQVISEPPTIDVASRKTSMLSEGMIPDEVSFEREDNRKIRLAWRKV